MKRIKTLSALLAAAALTIGFQAGANPHHGHHGGHGSHGQSSERTAEGVGELRSIAADGNSVVLHHEPIRALRWPAMTMELPLAEPALAEGLEAGDKISFTLRQTGPTDYVIVRLDAAQ